MWLKAFLVDILVYKKSFYNFFSKMAAIYDYGWRAFKLEVLRDSQYNWILAVKKILLIMNKYNKIHIRFLKY